jgi:hypothetical protein
MKCPGCGHENRNAAKFCEECAAPLGRKCSSCGAELRPVAKFCDECATPVTGAPPPRATDPRSYTPKHLAEKILTSRSALEGERKQVKRKSYSLSLSNGRADVATSTNRSFQSVVCAARAATLRSCGNSNKAP